MKLVFNPLIGVRQTLLRLQSIKKNPSGYCHFITAFYSSAKIPISREDHNDKVLNIFHISSVTYDTLSSEHCNIINEDLKLWENVARNQTFNLTGHKLMIHFTQIETSLAKWSNVDWTAFDHFGPRTHIFRTNFFGKVLRMRIASIR